MPKQKSVEEKLKQEPVAGGAGEGVNAAAVDQEIDKVVDEDAKDLPKPDEVDDAPKVTITPSGGEAETAKVMAKQHIANARIDEMSKGGKDAKKIADAYGANLLGVDEDDIAHFEHEGRTVSVNLAEADKYIDEKGRAVGSL